MCKENPLWGAPHMASCLYKIAHQASPQSKGAHYPESHDRAKRTERDRPSSNTVALPQEVELMPQYQNFSFKAAVAI